MEKIIFRNFLASINQCYKFERNYRSYKIMGKVFMPVIFIKISDLLKICTMTVVRKYQ